MSTDAPDARAEAQAAAQTAAQSDENRHDRQARLNWQNWREQRIATVSAPYGPLSLTGTHWLSSHPEGRIPAVPGSWTADGDEVVLTATAEDALTLDDKPFTGRVHLSADRGPISAARVAHGERRLFLLSREGQWAVRDFDPDSPARQAFQGVRATPYDPRWALPGRFQPYEEFRSVRVENADGRERSLGLDGELAFELGGEERTLRVAIEPDGSLWAVFADATSQDTGQDTGEGTGEDGSYRFRFLRPSVPATDGSVTVDFNYALLPPCAFADHFICPFPPPGNTLPVGVPAGERNLLGH